MHTIRQFDGVLAVLGAVAATGGVLLVRGCALRAALFVVMAVMTAVPVAARRRPVPGVRRLCRGREMDVGPAPITAVREAAALQQLQQQHLQDQRQAQAATEHHALLIVKAVKAA